MKAFIILLLVIVVFFGCAMVGYYIAFNMPQTPGDAAINVTPDGNFEEHRLLIVQVDRLDVESPKLVSVWFVSLYLVKESTPTLTFGQLYSPLSSRSSALNLEKSFALDARGEPVQRFWKDASAFGLEWEAYFMVDQLATQYILGWINGPGEYSNLMNNPEGTRALLQQTCQSLGGLAERESSGFDWAVIAPMHFRSNVRMENAVDYWNHITTHPEPPRCDVILDP